MNLIWNDYCNFLNEKTGLEFKEGYYWLDRSIVKAYDTQGKIHKIIRICIDDELNVTTKEYKKEKTEFTLESWYKTMERNKGRLLELESESKDLIKNMIDKYTGYEPTILTSTGKDSMLVWSLVNQVNNDTKSIFTNTSLDCADTYKFVKTLENTTIVNPKEGFYQFQKRLNFVPTRMYRACCDIFKEDSMIKQTSKDSKLLIFMGMRNQESSTRSGYTDVWKSTKWGDREWEGILPIRKWSEEEVWLYTLMKDIPINPKYKKGYSRIGCAVSCPFYTKSTWVLDKHWYPVMYNRWQNILDEDFTKNHKALVMNCTKEEYKLKSWTGTMLRTQPNEEVINEFAETNNLDITVAKKYFNHVCETCGKKIRAKDVIGMNMKLFGRNIEKFKCKKCLMKEFNWTKEDWDTQVDDFRSQGCKLF